MWQTPTPTNNQPSTSISDANASDVIANGKKTLGRRCIIVGHPTADKTLLQHCDVVVDENQINEILRTVSDARFVVMCGPRAMAETADMLTTRDRLVFQPQAGDCQHDPIPADQVLKAWSQMATSNLAAHVTPVADIFVSPNVKAFIGNHMGLVCTPETGAAAISWGLARSRNVLFLGSREVALALAAQAQLDPHKDVILWRPGVDLGGNTVAELKSKRLWVWDVEYSANVRTAEMSDTRLASILDELASGRTPHDVVSVPRATAYAAVKGIRRMTQIKTTP